MKSGNLTASFEAGVNVVSFAASTRSFLLLALLPQMTLRSLIFLKLL